MTITAKYAGICKTCGGRIEPGEQIAWFKADGGQKSYVRHTFKCHAQTVRVAAAPVATKVAPRTAPPAPASPTLPATAAQLNFLRNLSYRLSRIAMFDSFGADGPTEARDINAAIAAGLTKRQASDLIERAQALIEDEM